MSAYIDCETTAALGQDIQYCFDPVVSPSNPTVDDRAFVFFYVRLETDK
jgi:hypothetical protein